MEKRAVFLFAAMLTLFCIVVGRLLFLFTGGGKALTAGYQRSGYEVVIFRQRGAIYDSNLEVLTENDNEYRALVEPAKLTDDGIEILSEKALISSSNTEKNEHDFNLNYILNQKTLGKPFVLSVTEPFDAEGVSVFTFQKRYNGTFAAHILGYADGAGRGVLGIEKACDSLLTQETSVKAMFETDAARKPLTGSGYILDYKIKENPDGIVLTIDKNIQIIAEKAIDKRITKGAVLVVETETGDIKAMASRPAFDPSNVLEKLPDLEDGELLNNNLLPFNAGSAFKIVTAAAALEKGFPKSFRATCKGYYDTGTNHLRCYNGTEHGELGFFEAFAKSCNSFFCEVSAKIGKDAVYNTAVQLGFGSGMTLYEGRNPDGSGRIYSYSGNLPDIKDLSAPSALANFAIGQGALLVTPVQMTELLNIVATGGLYTKLSLTKGEVHNGKLKKTLLTTLPERVMTPETAQALKDYLVYAAKSGTGHLAVPENMSAAVKTSTAEAVEKKEKTRHVWTIGFFPADYPKYTLCVMAVGGNSGEYTAAPVFKEIADGIYNLEKAE